MLRLQALATGALALALVSTLGACGEEDAPTAGQTPTPAPTASAAPADPADPATNAGSPTAGPDPGAQATPTARGERPAITGTEWQLVRLGRTGALTSLPAGVPAPMLRIGDDGVVALFSGCNRGGGKATVRDDGTIAFGPIALTRRACLGPGADVERQVTTVIDGVVRASVDERGQLQLSKGRQRLVFDAA